MAGHDPTGGDFTASRVRDQTSVESSENPREEGSQAAEQKPEESAQGDAGRSGNGHADSRGHQGGRAALRKLRPPYRKGGDEIDLQDSPDEEALNRVSDHPAREDSGDEGTRYHELAEGRAVQGQESSKEGEGEKVHDQEAPDSSAQEGIKPYLRRSG
jgi:hypothetical protein